MKGISPDERQKTIDGLKLMSLYNNGISNNNKFIR